MQIAVLTSGGDAPGMNAVIAGVCEQVKEYGELNFGFQNVIGIHDGTWGLLDDEVHASTILDWSEWRETSGTVLGSVKGKKDLDERHYSNVKRHIDSLGIDALVVIGGDGSLRWVHELFQKADVGIPFICVPKTIDGDVPGLKGFSLGFKSARNHNANFIKSLNTNAEAMGMCHIIQIMGQRCGSLAMHSAVKSMVADIVLVPELGYNKESLVTAIHTLKSLGQKQIIIVVAEGIADLNGESLAKPRYGRTITAGKPNEYIQSILQSEFPALEIRCQNPGHSQRAPVILHPHDLKLGENLGRYAVQQLFESFTQLAEEPAMVVHGHGADKEEFNLVSLHKINEMESPKLSFEKIAYLKTLNGEFVCCNEPPQEIRRILTNHSRNRSYHSPKGLQRITFSKQNLKTASAPALIT